MKLMAAEPATADSSGDVAVKATSTFPSSSKLVAPEFAMKLPRRATPGTSLMVLLLCDYAAVFVTV